MGYNGKKLLPTLTGWVFWGLLTLWLVCMGLLTWFQMDHQQAAARSAAESYFDLHRTGHGWEGETHYTITKTSDPFLYAHLVTEHHRDNARDVYGRGIPFQPVVLLLDGDDNVLSMSCDFVHGPIGTGKDAPYLWAPLEREYFLSYDNGKPKFPNEDFSVFWYRLRLIGHQGTSYFHVLAMDYYYDGWEPLYAVPDADLSDAETVILENFKLVEYDYGEPVTRGGITYPSLSAFVKENGWKGGYSVGNTPLDTIEVAGQEFLAADGKTYSLVAVIRAWPLRSALDRLKWVYLGTFLPTVLFAFLLRRTIKKRIAVPLQELDYYMGQGWNGLLPGLDQKPHWAEIRQLARHYYDNQETLYHHETELTRLNTALEYAKEAEDNRRQMTSSIAHELKTPLAVIHSYAEGLQERINEEKREQYLQVILSEVQRMDGMVLEMLDLSRLEAGKVKLARDVFSLETLARTTFDRLELALQAKELALQYDIRCDSTITADEARIGQVITNFATNAVKYTPHGGKITVRVEKAVKKTRFVMENTCPPLSREALSKVWDTFYRTDSARSGEGTGLGLAISKSIIELHGGQVAVGNTMEGVEFRFVI